MKEQGLIPDNDSKSNEVFVMNFAEPEVVLDQESRAKDRGNAVENECDTKESRNCKPFILSDLTPEKTHKSMFHSNEVIQWSPSDYIHKDEMNKTNLEVIEECDLGTLNNDVYCELDFDKLEKLDGIENQGTNGITNSISSDVSNENSSKLSNKVSIKNEISQSNISGLPIDAIFESHKKSGEQANSEMFGAFNGNTDQDDVALKEESHEKVVGDIDFGNEAIFNHDKIQFAVNSGNVENDTEKEDVNGVTWGDFCSDECNDVHNKMKFDVMDENIWKKKNDISSKGETDNEKSSEVVNVNFDNEVFKAEANVGGERGIDFQDGKEICAKVCNTEEDNVGIDHRNSKKENEIANEVYIVEENEDEILADGVNKKDWSHELDRPLSNDNDRVMIVNDVERKETDVDKDGIREGSSGIEDSSELQWYERKRFDSCPNLGAYFDRHYEEVFTNGRILTRAATTKEKKSKSSYSKLKKHSQRRKASSEGSQLTNSKRLSFSMNSALGRLKQEYDASLAAFRKQRSKSLGLYRIKNIVTLN